ncbi:hypothetical protein BDN67DRAFT_999680 [Paxillus ammoniavirescens]|nr:hypothetical protein BDN67DRAFT_999680 [Paxillus ammoniavirescens]
MARKTQGIEDPSSDDDAPEVVSQSTSKANLKRDQKALRDFEARQKARKKAQNRERDQKLKDRALETKAAKRDATLIGKSFFDEDPHARDEDEDENGNESDVDESGDDDEGRALEARMLRAMIDAAEERESGEDDEEDDEEDEFTAFGGMDMDDDMRSDSRSASEEDNSDNEGDEIWQGMSNSDSEVDPEAPTDDEEMDGDSEDNEAAPRQKNTRKSNRRMDYLADDLFLAAFSSQKSKPCTDKGTTKSSKLRTLKKRRRKTNARAKDLVIGGRTIRTLPRASDPRSQATARTVPPPRSRKFIDHSLAVKGKQALLKAKRRGWERRPANIGVMKSEGAPIGFARSRQ